MKDKSKTEHTSAKKYTVTEEYTNTRLDNCLISKLKYLPKSKIYSITMLKFFDSLKIGITIEKPITIIY